MKYLILITILLVAVIVSGSDKALTIVASKNVPVQELKADTLKKIFLGKDSKWDNGTRIKLVICNERETLRKFTDDVIKMSVNQYRLYWKKLIFTGKGKAPKYARDESALLDFVKKNDNCIGFIIGSFDTNEVNHVRILN